MILLGKCTGCPRYRKCGIHGDDVVVVAQSGCDPEGEGSIPSRRPMILDDYCLSRV